MAATLDDIKDILEDIRDAGGMGGGPGAAGGAAGATPAERVAAEQAISAELEKQKAILAETTASAAKKAAAQKEVTKLLAQQNKMREEAEETEGKVGEAIGANLEMVRDMSEEIEGVGSGMDAIVAKSGKGGWTKLLSAGLEKIGKAAGTMGMNFLKTVNHMQSLRGEFRRTTGASAKLGRVMVSTYDSYKGYGVTLESATNSTKGLMEGMTDFTMLSGKQQKSLAGTAAVLSELGVSNEDFAKGVQNATKGLGVSVDDADDMMRELKATSIDLGIPTAELTRNFANMSGQLAKLGDNGVKAFKDLARVSKITGIEMNRLLQITDKFDTFEGAATQAGQLNAALGGNFVNAMELMEETDPAKRFEMIRDGIAESGLEFEDMGYYMKKMVAEASGMENAGELAKAMSGDMSSLDDQIGKTPDSMAAMAASAANLRSVTERLALQLKAAEPSVGAFDDKTKDAQEGVLGFTDKISKWIAGLWEGNEVLVIIASQVVGFITQFGLWGKVWDGLSKTVRGLWTGIKFLSRNGFKVLKTSITGIPKLFGGMTKAADKLFLPLANIAGPKIFGKLLSKIPLIGGVVSGLMNAWDGLTASFDAFSSGDFVGGIGHIFGAIFGFADGFLSAVPGFFVWIGQLFGWVDEDVDANSLISSLLSPIFDGLMDNFRAFIENFEGFGSDFANLLKEIPLFFWEMFKDLMGIAPMILDGILGAFGLDGFAVDLKENFFKAFEDAFTGAIDFVKDLLGIASDSSVFAEIGGNIIGGLISMLSPGPLIKAAKEMVMGLLKPFRNFGQLLMELVQGAMDMLPAPLRAAVNWLADAGPMGMGTNLAGAAMDRATGGYEMLSGIVSDASEMAKDPYTLNLAMNMDGREIGTKVVNVLGGLASEALNGE